MINKFKLFDNIKILTKQYKTNVNVFLMNKKQLEDNITIELKLILSLEKLISIAKKKHNDFKTQ